MKQTNQPEFSPHLLMAAKEIEEVMKKYDVAGVAVIQDPTGVKTAQRLDPSGTCGYMKGGAFGVTEPLVPKLSNPVAQAQALAERRETIFRTLNMVVNLQMVTATTLVALRGAESHIRKFFKLTPPPPSGANGKKIIT